MPKTSVINLAANDMLQWNGTNWVNTTRLVGVRASSVMAGGVSGEVMTSRGVSVDPEWAPNATFKTGLDTTRSFGQGNGDQVIAHGLGVTPKFVRVTAILGTGTSPNFIWSGGSYDGTNVAGISITNMPTNGNSGTVSSTTNILTMYEDIGIPEGHTVTIAIDATNITLTWTQTADQVEASGTIRVLWEAFG